MNAITERQIVPVHEGSALRSLRDSDAVARHWHKGNRAAWTVAGLLKSVEEAQRQIYRLKRRGGLEYGEGEAAKHPFKIYQSPSPPALWYTQWNAHNPTDTHTTADEWRFFRVRAGVVYPYDVLGTDGEAQAEHEARSAPISPNYDPDNTGEPEWNGGVEYVTPAWSNDIEIMVPAGEMWYVWIDCTDLTAPEINAAAVAPAGVFAAGTDYVLVGTIDCTDPDGVQEAIVRQHLRHDLMVADVCDSAGNTGHIFY